MKQSERTRGRGPATALFCFLNRKTMAGCRWKKNSYERDREKKMHGPLLILAFCRGGGGGGGGERERQEETSQSSARQKCGWLEVRSCDDEKKLRASCPALWMKFTTTKTR